METFERAALVAKLADEKKAADITILDVRGLCNFADAFLICTGNNRVHLNAISDAIGTGMKRIQKRPALEDGHRNASWVVMDYGDVIIHIMSPEARSFYRLEKLWGDAKDVAWTPATPAETTN